MKDTTGTQLAVLQAVSLIQRQLYVVPNVSKWVNFASHSAE